METFISFVKLKNNTEFKESKVRIELIGAVHWNPTGVKCAPPPRSPLSLLRIGNIYAFPDLLIRNLICLLISRLLRQLS